VRLITAVASVAVVGLVLHYGYDANVDFFGFGKFILRAPIALEPTPVPAAPSTDSAAPTAPTNAAAEAAAEAAAASKAPTPPPSV
jgi:hypothetical protein